MGYFTLFILLFVFSWLIYGNFLKTTLSKSDLLIGWGIKLASGIVFMLIMSYHFSKNGQPLGDIGNFIHDGQVLNEYAQNDPIGYLKLLAGINADDTELLNNELKETRIWDYGITSDSLNDNRLIIRINSIIEFVSFRNYWVNVLVFSFISFIGVLLLYKVIEPFVARKKTFFYALLLAPSVAFWGSGITKETILVFALGVFFVGLTRLIQKVRLLHLIILLLGIWLCVVNKPHVGLVIIPLSILIYVGYKFTLKKKNLVLITLGMLALFILFCFTPKKINVVDRISHKQQDLINVAKGGVFFINDSSFCAFDYQDLEHFNYDVDHKLISVNSTVEGEYKLFGEKTFHPFILEPDTTLFEVYLVVPPSETYVNTEPINNEPLQLVKNTPNALFNVLIRPLPSDNGSNFKYISFLENIVFLSFLIFVFFNRRTFDNKSKVWVFYLVISAIVLILIIGWTAPIIGAVVRYKMAAYLLLLLAAFITWKSSKKLIS